jgi:hypothetical protein
MVWLSSSKSAFCQSLGIESYYRADAGSEVMLLRNTWGMGAAALFTGPHPYS